MKVTNLRNIKEKKTKKNKQKKHKWYPLPQWITNDKR